SDQASALQHVSSVTRRTRLMRSQGVELFDHLIGAHKQRRWDLEAKRLGGLEVDDKYERGRLQYWQFGRLCATQNTADVEAGLSIPVRDTGSVAHQATGLDELSRKEHRGNDAPCRQPYELVTLAE